MVEVRSKTSVVDATVPHLAGQAEAGIPADVAVGRAAVVADAVAVGGVKRGKA
jgi:hypothetical protein